MTDPDEPVVLTQTQTGFEAETIVKALEAHGVIATSADVATNVTWGGMAGSFALAKVMVRRDDLERARNALRAIKADSIDIDWSEVDVGDEEPAGSGRLGRDRWFYLAVGLLIVLGVLGVTTGARNDIPAVTTIGAILFGAAGIMAVLPTWTAPGAPEENEDDEPDPAEPPTP